MEGRRQQTDTILTVVERTFLGGRVFDLISFASELLLVFCVCVVRCIGTAEFCDYFNVRKGACGVTESHFQRLIPLLRSARCTVIKVRFETRCYAVKSVARHEEELRRTNVEEFTLSCRLLQDTSFLLFLLLLLIPNEEESMCLSFNVHQLEKLTSGRFQIISEYRTLKSALTSATWTCSRFEILGAQTRLSVLRFLSLRSCLRRPCVRPSIYPAYLIRPRRGVQAVVVVVVRVFMDTNANRFLLRVFLFFCLREGKKRPARPAAGEASGRPVNDEDLRLYAHLYIYVDFE